MNRIKANKLIVLMLVIAFAVFSVACSASAPKKAIVDSLEALSNSDGFDFEFEFAMTSGEENESVKMGGTINKKDFSAKVTLEMEDEKGTLYLFEKDDELKLYTQEEGKEVFDDSDDISSMLGSDFSMFKDALTGKQEEAATKLTTKDYEKIVKEVTKSGNEKIDDVDCVKYSVKLDSEAIYNQFIEALEKEESASQELEMIKLQKSMIVNVLDNTSMAFFMDASNKIYMIEIDFTKAIESVMKAFAPSETEQIGLKMHFKIKSYTPSPFDIPEPNGEKRESASDLIIPEATASEDALPTDVPVIFPTPSPSPSN